MAAKNRRVKADDINAVTSKEQLITTVATIGDNQLRIDELEAEMNRQINAIKEQFDQDSQPLNDEIKVLTKAAQVYVSANRDELIDPKKKSVELETGEIGFRTTPHSVRLKEEQSIITELNNINFADVDDCNHDDLKKLVDAINVTRKLDRRELLNQRMTIESMRDEPDLPVNLNRIEFKQKEEFFIKPSHEALDAVEQVE